MSPKPADTRPRVLVTGAAGRLGGLAVAHLRGSGRCEVAATDMRPVPGGTVADLTLPADRWAGLLEGVDAILHCAGHRGPDTCWEDAQRLNIDLSLRLMTAARGRVSRFVFLSSNWVMAGRRFGGERLTTELPPDPINPYGLSKLAIERAGVAFAEAGDFGFVALRIGMVLADERGAADRLGTLRRWSQEMWLAGADFCRGIEQALFAPISDPCVVNLVSDNPGSRWDLCEARRRIGYEPAEGRAAEVTPELDAAEAAFARLDRCRAEAVARLTGGSKTSPAEALAACRSHLSEPGDDTR